MDVTGDRPALSRHAEIANLEHELVVLRERYANLLANERRLAVILLYGTWATGAVVAILVIYALVTGNVFGAVIVIVIAVSLAIGSHTERQDESRYGAIYDAVFPYGRHKRFVEQAIEVHEQRLRELKAQS